MAETMLSWMAGYNFGFRKNCVQTRLPFLLDHRFYWPEQSGFLPGHSTITQLIEMYDAFCKSLSNKNDIRVIFCDISKAFDRVWHEALLLKLQNAGIDGIMLEWFHDYLSDRKQRV